MPRPRTPCHAMLRLICHFGRRQARCSSFLWRGRSRPRKNVSMPSAMGTKYNYRRRLPHFQYDDKPLFITFATYTHTILGPLERDLMLRHCLHDHDKKYLLHAAVVMPEHVHTLLSPLRDGRGDIFPLQQICNPLRVRQPTASVKRPAGKGRCGKKSPLTTCCDPTKAWKRNSNTSVRIP